MEGKKSFNHHLSIFGWGAIFIWWSVAAAVGPITLAMTAIGTGLILLGINLIRVLRGIHPVSGSTNFGLVLLLWGALDQARAMLGLPEALSFALILFVIGLKIWLSPLLNRVTEAR